MIRCVPDITVTRHVDDLGRFSFGLRRHRWMFESRPLRPHARNLGMFARLVDPGCVAYDVGANIGYYTRFIARHLQPAEVVAFEPMTANLKVLRRNAQGSSPVPVRVLPIALSDRDDRELLQLDDLSDGSSVLDRISGGQPSETRQRLGLRGKTEEVHVRTLDRVIPEERLEPPGFIKIDTEGAEATVLVGAKETLDRHGPHIAIASHGPDLVEQVLDLLSPLGYHAFGFLRDGDALRYGRLDASTRSSLGDNNFVTSRDEARLTDPISPFCFNLAT